MGHRRGARHVFKSGPRVCVGPTFIAAAAATTTAKDSSSFQPANPPTLQPSNPSSHQLTSPCYDH